jgi:hypothetical protein
MGESRIINPSDSSVANISDDWVLIEQDRAADGLHACTGSSTTTWSTSTRLLMFIVVPLVAILLVFLLSPNEFWNFWSSVRPLFVGEPDYAKMTNFLTTKLICPSPFLEPGEYVTDNSHCVTMNVYGY